MFTSSNTLISIDGIEINIKLAFKRINSNSDLLEKAIGKWTKSKYSHVEIIIGTKWISSLPGKGVHVLDLLPLNNTWDYHDLGKLRLSELQYNTLITWVKQQDGKDYDWVGIFFSQILPLQMNDTDDWFCSEYVTKILQLIGLLEVQDLQPNLVSPGKLAKVFKLE